MPAPKGLAEHRDVRLCFSTDGVWLWNKEIGEEEIRKVVAARGFFPEDTPITNYPEDFIHGWLLTYWQQVVTFINENIRK